MHGERLGDLLADREDRVEAGHRLLEDHRNVLAANLAHLLFRKSQQVAPAKHDLALDAARFFIEKPHDGKRGHALARAAFADDRHRFARCNLETHIAHHGFPAVINAEGGGEILNRKNRAYRTAGLFH
ncbi:hypothetical protein D3C72_1695330 [compost metagenome]